MVASMGTIIDIISALFFFMLVGYGIYFLDAVLTDLRDMWRRHHGRT